MITIQRCTCGFKGQNGGECQTFWLVGIGVFVQGSGFTQEEAQRIADALNGNPIADPPDADDHTVTFRELLLTQQDLQVEMGDPTGHGEPSIKENLFQAIVEVVEALREINFKPWSRKKVVVDKQKLATEITDVFQFLANAANSGGISPEDLSRALHAKWAVNYQRIQDGEATSR